MKVLVFLAEHRWIATLIERDIMAQGLSIGDALERLDLTVSLEAKSRDGTLDGIDTAPERYAKAWEQGSPMLIAPDIRFSRRMAPEYGTRSGSVEPTAVSKTGTESE